METDTTSRLGNLSALLECIVDTFNRVVLHGDEEARGHLGLGSTSVEESGSCVSEVAERQEVVGFLDGFHVVTVDTDGNAEEHVLRTLDDSKFSVLTAFDTEEVRAFEGLVAEVFILEITTVVDHFLEFLSVLLDDFPDVFSDKRSGLVSFGANVFAKNLEGFEDVWVGDLVESADSETTTEETVVGVLGDAVGGSLSDQFVKFVRGNAIRQTLDDVVDKTLDINIVAIETESKSVDTSVDLFRRDGLLRTIAFENGKI
jgi:hypothetical protein